MPPTLKTITTLPEAARAPTANPIGGILAGSTTVEGLNVSQDLRWSIIRRLNRYNVAGAAALVEAEAARDKSDTGQAAAIAATVVRPDAQVKAQWLATVEDLQTKQPFSKIRTAMGELDTIHVKREPRDSRGDSVEVWLAPGQEWYPVKIRFEDERDTIDQTVKSITRK